MTEKERAIIITAYIEGDLKSAIENMARFSMFPSADEFLKGSYIICADGGFLIAKESGIRPDILIGDFDSLKDDGEKQKTENAGIEVIRYPSKKDYTDTGLAIHHAKEKGFKEVFIAGGIGGRLDHTLANIQDVAGFSAKGLSIVMADGLNLFTILGTGDHRISRSYVNGEDASKYLSLLSYTPKSVISITGTEYPLDRHEITNTFPLGVSNKIIGAEAIVTVHEGAIILIIA